MHSTISAGLMGGNNYLAEFKNKSNFISTESNQQILPDYEDLITLLEVTSNISSILLQEIKFLNGFVTNQYDLRAF